MNGFIQACIEKSRAVLMILFILVISGIWAYISIPKESDPDVKIPIMYVVTSLHGISPPDAENLLIKPLEQKLRSIEGLKEVRSLAYEGGANIVLEFNAGFDLVKAKNSVKDQVDLAKSELPRDADQPIIHEVNPSLFPVLAIKLSGDIPDRALYKMADDLKDSIESQVPAVLSAEVLGKRKEMIEIVIDPQKVVAYNLDFYQVMDMFRRNNSFVTGGEVITKSGSITLNIPGLVDTVEQIADFPIKATGNAVIRFKDIATIKRGFEDANQYTRDRGRKAVIVEVTKRTGENIIDTIDKVKDVVENQKKIWPQHVNVSYSQDRSKHIRDMLNNLQNNVVSAIILVMLVIIGSLGIRSSLLIGFAVPGSFLVGIFVIWMMGYTVNIVVLFSLILSVGMLVDGAIIVVEYADKEIAAGVKLKQAFIHAAQRMLWPVISSTATILVAFAPLLFWPGVIGQFMKFLPITLIITLTASIVMALIFVPVLGIYVIKGKNKGESKDHDEPDDLVVAKNFSVNKVSGFTGWYVRKLDWALNRPGKVILSACGILVGVIFLYKSFGAGTEFFPNVEADQAVINIYARGNLGIDNKDEIVKKVEKLVLDMKELKSVYAKVGAFDREDQIGAVYLEFIDWRERRRVPQINEEILAKAKEIPGILVEVSSLKGGPSQGKPIVLSVSHYDTDKLLSYTKKIKNIIESVEGVVDVEDNMPLPNIEWKINLDRADLAKMGSDIISVGNGIKMLTNGVLLGKLRPLDSRDEIDIRVRYPAEDRTLFELNSLKIGNPALFPDFTNPDLVNIPLSIMIDKKASLKVSRISRTDGKRNYTIKADVKTGVLVSSKVNEIGEKLKPLMQEVEITFKGEDKEQKEAAGFLMRAFLVSLACICLILVLQFNSFFSAFLVLSAVILSIIGVLLGMLITRTPFGVVMGGIGVISLGGIIVSNNIIFIDTFDILKHSMNKVRDAILCTGAQRLRPVILTKLTTVLGLLPIMFKVDIDFIAREITYNAPSTAWWVQIATTIVSGVFFASILTLIITPCALMLKHNFSTRNKR